MFFIFSKILLFLTYPFTWVIILLISSFLVKSDIWKRRLRITSLIVFLIFSNTYIFNEIHKAWEGRNQETYEEKYDAVILLGGYSGWNARHQVVSFNEGSDRFIYAMEVYKRGMAKKILLSGGSGLLWKPEEKESTWAYQFFLTLGVDEKDLILETESRNTHENASFSTQILNEMYPNGKFLLLTSAYHMRRAKRCFEKYDLDFDCMRVDFQVDDDDYDFETYLLPSPLTLGRWPYLIKEFVGYVVYWIKGYF